MKPIISFILILVLSSLACSPVASAAATGKGYLPTATATPETYTVTAEFLNVRQFPDGKSAGVGTLEKGAVLECLQTVSGIYGGRWCNTGSGWIDMAWVEER